MSNGIFVVALVTGAALLAGWTYVRFPGLAPERLGRTLLHVVVASVLLRLSPALGSSLGKFALVFLVVLPALVYALLATIWMLQQARVALGLR